MEKDILERFYKKYAKQVYLYLYSFCHNREVAEDLMQETFLRAFCTLERQEEVLPWLLKVARNLYLDTWRKEKKIVDGVEIEKTSQEKEILDTFIQQEQNKRLYQAIQSLEEREREIVVLYYFAELSQEKISQMLNISNGNVRVMLHRTKRKLKTMLMEDDRK